MNDRLSFMVLWSALVSSKKTDPLLKRIFKQLSQFKEQTMTNTKKCSFKMMRMMIWMKQGLLVQLLQRSAARLLQPQLPKFHQEEVQELSRAMS